jgi:hypothetical protein
MSEFSIIQEEDRFFIKSFIIDETLNLNFWATTDAAIDNDLSTFIGKPFVITPDAGHPDAVDGQQLMIEQEKFRVGTIIEVGRDASNGKAWAISEITDKKAQRQIQDGEIRFVSPSITFNTATDLISVAGKDIVTRFSAAHLAGVKEPAYGMQKAQIKGSCSGSPGTCIPQLGQVQASIRKSACGKVLTVHEGTKVMMIKNASECMESCLLDKSEQGLTITDDIIARCYTDCKGNNTNNQDRPGGESIDINVNINEAAQEGNPNHDDKGQFTGPGGGGGGKSKDDKSKSPKDLANSKPPITSNEVKDPADRAEVRELVSKSMTHKGTILNTEKKIEELETQQKKLDRSDPVERAQARELSSKIGNQRGKQGQAILSLTKINDKLTVIKNKQDKKEGSVKPTQVCTKCDGGKCTCSSNKAKTEHKLMTDENINKDEKSSEEELEEKRKEDAEEKKQEEAKKADEDKKSPLDAEDDDEDEKKDARIKALEAELHAEKLSFIDQILAAKKAGGHILAAEEKSEAAKLGGETLVTLKQLAAAYLEKAAEGNPKGKPYHVLEYSQASTGDRSGEAFLKILGARSN